MQALVWRGEAFHFEECPSEPLRRNEARVSVRAIGVNRADILQRRGLYPAPMGVRPDVLGLECSGVITEVSTECIGKPSDWLGRNVMVLLAGEAYGNEVVVDLGCVMFIPEHLTFTEAAAIPEAFITAYDALWIQANLQSGRSICIHAVGSGVGDAARQLCVAKGYEVYGTTRSPEKAKQLTTEACPVVHIQEGVFPSTLPKVDLILDFVGAAYLKSNISLLKPQGHLQVVGLLGGAKADINLAKLLAKRLTVRGATLRSRSIIEKTKLVERFTQEVMPLFTDRMISPTIDTVYSWEEVEHAHHRMIENKNIGKIVLKVD